jgi:hypothetical protein
VKKGKLVVKAVVRPVQIVKKCHSHGFTGTISAGSTVKEVLVAEFIECLVNHREFVIIRNTNAVEAGEISVIAFIEPFFPVLFCL